MQFPSARPLKLRLSQSQHDRHIGRRLKTPKTKEFKFSLWQTPPAEHPISQNRPFDEHSPIRIGAPVRADQLAQIRGLAEHKNAAKPALDGI